jgi:hypothetical protein
VASPRSCNSNTSLPATGEFLNVYLLQSLHHRESILGTTSDTSFAASARLIRERTLCDIMGPNYSEIFSGRPSLISFGPSRSPIATLREQSLKFSESLFVSTCGCSCKCRPCGRVCVRTEAVLKLLLQSFNGV